MMEVKHIIAPRHRSRCRGGKRRLALEIIASAIKDLVKTPRSTEGEVLQRTAKLFFLGKTEPWEEVRARWLDIAGIDEDALNDRIRRLVG